MPTMTATVYEVMFLIGQGTAANLAGVIDHINHLFERAGADVVAMRKWDERRLAFEIDKQKRGVYILAYVRIPADHVTSFERDCNLSEQIMRVLVLRADHLGEDEIKVHDLRDELAVEARMRSEAAATEGDNAHAGVSLGAPARDDVDLDPDLNDGIDDEDGEDL